MLSVLFLRSLLDCVSSQAENERNSTEPLPRQEVVSEPDEENSDENSDVREVGLTWWSTNPSLSLCVGGNG